jgi:hypothetical protein
MISDCDIKKLMFRNENGGYPLFQKKKKKDRTDVQVLVKFIRTLD